jgi:hypothetical protein
MSQVHRRNIGCAIIQFCKEAYSPQVIANHYHDGCWPSRIEAAGMDGRLMTRTILLERVWDFRFDPKSSIVETHVSRRRLRSAAGRNVLYAPSWLKPGEIGMAEAGDLEKAHAQVVKARDEAVAALAEGKGIDGQAELLLKFSKRD